MEAINYRQLKAHFLAQLASVYPKEEAASLFHYALSVGFGIAKKDFLLLQDERLSEAELEQWILIFKELKAEKPIQYILSKAEFMNMVFEVNPNVLIPRPETEELVHKMLQDLDPNKQHCIIDIGCGSGCIGISLAKHLSKATVYLLDVSASALSTAESNAQKLLNQNDRKRIHFMQADVLKQQKLWLNFDVIVSNPPYVSPNEKAAMRANVLNHEPHLALFVPENDPLIFYRKILTLALQQTALKTVYFEINQYLATATEELAKSMHFSTTLLRDLHQNHRILIAKPKPL